MGQGSVGGGERKMDRGTNKFLVIYIYIYNFYIFNTFYFLLLGIGNSIIRISAIVQHFHGKYIFVYYKILFFVNTINMVL